MTELVLESLDRPLVLAALFEHESELNELDSALWLPHQARSHMREWLAFALSVWRQRAPDYFPAGAEWESASDWASTAENAARAQLAQFEASESKRRAEADAERAALTEAVDAAQISGTTWRAILTENGGALVAAVADALTYLGFDVVDADQLPEHKGKKREDLRVRDGDWTALGEVKGYGGAAKSNDLVQLQAAAPSFAAATGRTPDAVWYIVNAQREVDPAQRDIPLRSRSEDLAAFGSSAGGLVIDTRDLFRLRQLVAAGTSDAVEARNRLKAATGRFNVSV